MVDVYYVEDDETIAQAVKEYLEERDCKVSNFQTVMEAKAALRACIPAILLLDWNLPDGQGNEFCQWIRLR